MNSLPPSPTFWQWLTSIDSGDLAGLSFLAGCCFIAFTLILSVTAHFMYKNRLQNALKRDMLERGFDAEEIALAVHGTPRAAKTDSGITDPFHALKVKQ
jgi:hypothetical protein